MPGTVVNGRRYSPWSFSPAANTVNISELKIVNKSIF